VPTRRPRHQRVGYREKLAQLLHDQAYRRHRAGKTELAEELHQAARELWDESETVDGVVVADVSPSDARAVLEGLVDCGLIRPPLGAPERDELAEKDAEIARLKTQLSEFTVVV
jgi:dihydrodipicolinate synthase/N-acetylneuraminate lyase